jgi:hypothetical protein
MATFTIGISARGIEPPENLKKVQGVEGGIGV